MTPRYEPTRKLRQVYSDSKIKSLVKSTNYLSLAREGWIVI